MFCSVPFKQTINIKIHFMRTEKRMRFQIMYWFFFARFFWSSHSPWPLHSNGVNTQNMLWLHISVHFKWNRLNQHKCFLMSQFFGVPSFFFSFVSYECMLRGRYDAFHHTKHYTLYMHKCMCPNHRDKKTRKREHWWCWWANVTPYWHTLNVSLCAHNF